MMNRLDVVAQKANRTKNQIIHILEQLTSDYQTTKSERQEIAANFPASNDEFSVLEELELLTVNIRGYASQIQSMKAYLEMLDYLRLLIIEYLSFSAISSIV